MNEMDELKKDLEANKKNSNRADFFKLQNGDNKIVILSNPVGYSEMYNVGIAYDDCGYGKYASRKYKSYVLDLRDDTIKIANFSYTVATAVLALSEGERTKFDGFPMPYIINLKTENAGKKEIAVQVIAGGDYHLTDEQKSTLATFDSIRDIIDRLKVAQKKKVESDPAMQEKIENMIAEREKENKERAEKKAKDAEIPTIRHEAEDAVEYPEEEVNVEDIPF